jgi:GT2 family glycosyltransferase
MRETTPVPSQGAGAKAAVRITAVVVTFNRKALLLEVIEALLRQTRRPNNVLIIDNASTDGTVDAVGPYLSRQDFEYVRLDCNTGGAGGFHVGMKHAVESGADWLWCMDDDCVPCEDALEALLAPLRDTEIAHAGWLASRVLWTDGNPCLMNLPVAHPLWIAPHARHATVSQIVGSSLVSMLVSSAAIRQLGLPVKEFFIWFDDAEFSRRISAKMPCYLVTDSVVIHKTPLNMAPLDFDRLDASSLWKFCYGVRNECSFHFRTGGPMAGLRFSAKIALRLLRARTPLTLGGSILGACLKGAFFNYPALIEFPSASLPPEPAMHEK